MAQSFEIPPVHVKWIWLCESRPGSQEKWDFYRRAGLISGSIEQSSKATEPRKLHKPEAELCLRMPWELLESIQVPHKHPKTIWKYTRILDADAERGYHTSSSQRSILSPVWPSTQLVPCFLLPGRSTVQWQTNTKPRLICDIAEVLCCPASGSPRRDCKPAYL